MANLNLGQDVAEKRKKIGAAQIVANSYPPISCKDASLRFSNENQPCYILCGK